MNKGIIITLIVVVLLGGGFYFYQQSQSKQNDAMMAKEDAMMEKDGDEAMVGEEGAMMEGYSGKVLAGKTSPLVEFNQADYDAAKASGKTILLYFYANWCPICRVESPIIMDGFNGLTTDQLVGFRVNFNDSDTDDSEKALADEFNVTYQHTKVFVRGEEEVSRSGEAWESEDFEAAVNQAIR